MRSLVRWSHADCHSPRCQPYQCGGLLNATDVDYRTLATLCSSCACSGCELCQRPSPPPWPPPPPPPAAPAGDASCAPLLLSVAVAATPWVGATAGPRHRPVAQAEEVEGLGMDLD